MSEFELWGIPKPRNWNLEPLTFEEIKIIHDFYWSHEMSQKDISDYMGCHVQTLHSRMKKAGFSCKKPPPTITLVEGEEKLPNPRNYKRQPLSEDEVRIAHRYYLATSLGYKDVAKLIGISPQNLSKKFTQYGLGFRNRREAAINRGMRHRGPNNHKWKGGRKITDSGYVLVVHPDRIRRKSGKGYVTVYEHRLIWEQINGPIPQGWEIHHLNGVKDDNRIENLQALPCREHREYIPKLKEQIKILHSRLRVMDCPVDFAVVDY